MSDDYESDEEEEIEDEDDDEEYTQQLEQLKKNHKKNKTPKVSKYGNVLGRKKGSRNKPKKTLTEQQNKKVDEIEKEVEEEEEKEVEVEDISFVGIEEWKWFKPRFTKDTENTIHLLSWAKRRKENKTYEEKLEQVLNTLLASDLQAAIKQVKNAIIDVHLYPSSKDKIQKNMNLSDFPKQGFVSAKSSNSAFSEQFKDTGAFTETLLWNNLSSDIYFFDLEQHIFKLDPHIRELGCISLDGTKAFKSPVRFVRKINSEYIKVDNLAKEQFESDILGFASLHKKHNTLFEPSDSDKAPSFDEAFTAMLLFIKKVGVSPIIIFQGNTDTSHLVYNITHAIPDTTKKNALMKLLTDVHPRFVRMDSFWESMHLILGLDTPDFPKNLPKMSKSLFFKELRDTVTQADKRLFNSVAALYASQNGDCEPVLRANTTGLGNVRFSLDYDPISNDVNHHNVDNDCMLMRNCSSALLLFCFLLTDLQTPLQAIMNNPDIDDDTEYEVDANAPGLLDRVVNYLLGGLLHNNENSQQAFFERYRNMFSLFMSGLAKHTTNFTSSHLPLTKEMIAMILHFTVGFPIYSPQRPNNLRRLETYSDAGIVCVSEEYEDGQQIFLYDAKQVRSFEEDIRKHHMSVEFPSEKERKLWEKIQRVEVRGGYEVNLIQKMYNFYLELAERSPSRANRWERERIIREVVFVRRNWPIFYVKNLPGTNVILHNRFCPSLIGITECEIDGVKSYIRTYTNMITIATMQLYSNVFSTHSSTFGNVKFCKQCKRFERDEDLLGQSLQQLAFEDEELYTFDAWFLRNEQYFIRQVVLENPRRQNPDDDYPLPNLDDHANNNVKPEPNMHQQNSNRMNQNNYSTGVKQETVNEEDMFNKIEIQEEENVVFNAYETTKGIHISKIGYPNLREHDLFIGMHNTIKEVLSKRKKSNKGLIQPFFINEDEYTLLWKKIRWFIFQFRNSPWQAERVNVLCDLLEWLAILFPVQKVNINLILPNNSPQKICDWILYIHFNDETKLRKLTYLQLRRIQGIKVLLHTMYIHEAWCKDVDTMIKQFGTSSLKSALREYKKIYCLYA